MSIERETGLNDYIETGIPVGGKLTSELLTNIFIPNAPLHDGAVVIRDDEIVAAACYLPLSESAFHLKRIRYKTQSGDGDKRSDRTR